MKKKLPFTFRLTVYLLIVHSQFSIFHSLPARQFPIWKSPLNPSQASPSPLASSLPQIIDLQGPWQFREHGGKDWLPAQVPGTVHTDLLAANLIPDPYAGLNESKLQWIEQLDWEYRKTITLTEQQLAHAKADLIFEGLDTYADIYLNGQLLQRCDNMHRRWVVPCKPYLRVGENELRVEFHSPMQVAMAAYTASPFQLPAGNDAAEIKLSPYVRKAAYHFGWDFGPRFVTAGIWRPAHIRLWDHAILEDLNARPLELLPLEARMSATVDLDIATPGNYQVNLLADGELLLSADRELDRGKQRVELQFTLHNPRFWWPKGMGEPALYDLQAQVRHNQEILDEKHQSLGLRTIQLIRQPDAMGTSFYFSINDFLPQGGPLYIKGANHVPADAFLPRARSRETQLLEAAEAVGMNMLRVWGGGTYADDHFYQWCDSHGILIWQDLAFACMMYPLEGPFLENALAEVEENVQRLRNHPSLALWCGNNEIAVAWQNWGWQQQFGYSEAFSHQLWSQYQTFFEDRVPRLINTLDPGRPWITTSPLSNWGKAVNFNHHNMHYWGVWHGTDSLDGFSNYVPRFMSEYGFQSWPSPATLQHYTATPDWNMDSPVMRNRQKSYKGNAPILRFLSSRYGTPSDFTNFILLSQLLQRDAMNLAIEAHRTAMPHNMGTLYWQLGDCWPGASWSTIDYDGAWKPAHYALKRLYAPVLVSAQTIRDTIHIRIASELPEKLCNLQVRLKSFDGDVRADYETAVTLKPGAAEYLCLPLAALSGRIDNALNLVEVVLHRGREILGDDIIYFVPPRDMDLPDPDFHFKVTAAGDRYKLDLSATTLVKDMEIQIADKNLQATCSDNFFDLVPGRPRTVWIQAPGAKDAATLLNSLRFRDLSRLMK